MEKPEGITLWPKSVGLVVLNDGTEFYCPQTLNAIRHIVMCYLHSIYDPKPIELTEDDEIIVDVGGYIGMFGIYAAKKTGGKTYIFEPLPHMKEFCDLNVKVNNLGKQVRVSGLAVDAEKGTRTLRFWQNNPEMGYFGKTDGKYNLSADIDVETISLDNLGLPKIDFLKLNCEGAEGYIFPAMSKSLLENTKKISLQMHEELSPIPGEEIKKILGDAGFEFTDSAPEAKVHWIYAWR